MVFSASVPALLVASAIALTGPSNLQFPNFVQEKRDVLEVPVLVLGWLSDTHLFGS
jgi:hypothetical protein